MSCPPENLLLCALTLLVWMAPMALALALGVCCGLHRLSGRPA